MTQRDTSPFDDLLDPLRASGWSATVEDRAIRLEHPVVGVIDLDAETPEGLRGLLSSAPFVDPRFLDAIRRAPTDRPDDLATVRGIIRACRPFSSNPRLPSAVLGVLADRGLVADETYEWFHGHADVLVDWAP
jgi:hypothetical protein